MRNRAQGFTLIEMLITIAIVAIVAALAAPSLRDLVLNNQRAAQLNAMVASMSLARAEAVKSGRNAIVCISDGAANPDCDGGATEWEQGWLVVVDTDGDGNISRADGDQVVDIREDLADGTTLRAVDGGGNDVSAVTYEANGESDVAGTFSMCDPRGAADARSITIELTGRASVVQGGVCP